MEQDLVEMLLQIQSQTSSIDGRLGAVENFIQEMRSFMRDVAAFESRLSHLERNCVQHDKRVAALENRCHEWGPVLESVTEHLKSDKPMEVVAGTWALRILMLAGGALGFWLLEKVPKILELLK